MADIVQPDIALKDLEERWGIARNTLKNWADKLGVDIKRPTPRSAYWPGEYIDLGDQLKDWMRAGNELAAFPYILSLTDQKAPVSQQPEPSAIVQAPGSQLATTTDDSQLTDGWDEDPHAAWDDFEKALAGLRWYSTDAMAVILRRTRSAVAGWPNGKEVYPDCFLEKRKVGNDVYWRAFCQAAVADGSDMSVTG